MPETEKQRIWLKRHEKQLKWLSCRLAQQKPIPFQRPVHSSNIVDTGVFMLAVNNNATATSFNWVHMALSTAILIIGLVLMIVYEKKGPMAKKNQ
jgi:hypothetical protein